MKTLYILLFISTIVLMPGRLMAQESETMVHTSSNDNILFNYTALDNATLNGQSAAYPIFTHSFNPGGGSGTYADKKMGVWYSGSIWKIFNQDGSSFTANKHFNVLIPGPDVKAWKHVANQSNTFLNRTTIDHPEINGDPNAIVFVSSAWTGVYDTNVNGIYYNNSDQKWKIFNQGGPGQLIQNGVEFNVIIPKTSSKYKSFVHTSTPANTSSYITTIDHTGLNYNPDAVLFVTANYNPGGSGGVYNNHNVGVYYNGSKWCIYNEDKVALPDGAAFNVLAFELNPPTAIDKPLITTDVKVFPNPASVHAPLTITLDDQLEGDLQITLISSNGVPVYNEIIRKSTSRSNHQLQLNGIPRGLYVLKVEGNGKVGKQKIIIQ